MSFLRDYLAYSANNEAPVMFHVWAGYFCLATAVSRRVWLPFSNGFVYPNIYVMLVGGAGNAKNIAINHAKYVLALTGDVTVSGSVETPEGTWRFMAGEPDAKPPVESPVKKVAMGPLGQLIEFHPMAIVATEFVNFISHNPEGWVNALNDIFDCADFLYRTKNKGTDTLTNPYITLLGALTTEISSSLQKQNIIGSGLARRTFFQHGDRQWDNPIPWPVITQVELSACERAVAHLQKLQRLSGQFTLPPETMTWWDEWYRSNHAQVNSNPPNLRSWYGTKAARLMELGMLTSLSEGLDMVIRPEHLQVSLDYLTQLELDLPKIFGGVGRNELAAIAQKIYEYIEALGRNPGDPVSGKLIRKIFYNECRPPNDFNDILNFLKETDQIVEKSIQVGQAWDTVFALPEVMKKWENRTGN